MTVTEAIESLRAAVTTAALQWAGLEWNVEDTDAAEWARVLRELRSSRDQEVDDDRAIIDEHASVTGWWSETDNAASEQGRSLCRRLRTGINYSELELAIADAEWLQARAERHVAEAAEQAHEFALGALVALEAGEYDTAMEQANDAARCERSFGDAPVYSRVVTAVDEAVKVVREARDLAAVVSEVLAAGAVERVLLAHRDVTALVVLEDEWESHASLQVDSSARTLSCTLAADWVSLDAVVAALSAKAALEEQAEGLERASPLRSL